MATTPSAAAWDAFVAPYWQAAQEADDHAQDTRAGCVLLRAGQLRGALRQEALAWVHGALVAAHSQHVLRMAAADDEALPELLQHALYALDGYTTCCNSTHRVCMRYCEGAPRAAQQAADDLAAVQQRMAH